MKVFVCAISIFSVSLTLAQKVDVPKEIRAIYDAQAADMKKGDYAHFFSYYDPGFIAISPTGKKSSLSTLKSDVEKMNRGSSNRSISLKYTACKSTPTKVEVSYICDFSTTYHKGKKTSVDRMREIGTDTWIKGPSGWKETKTVDKSFGPIK